MRKKVFGRKLSRDRGSRTALFRALIRSMVQHGKIVTTKAKAKAVQPSIEKLVSVSKTKDPAVIRRVFSYLGNDKKTLEILRNQIAKSFQDRKGGFTRLINLPRRMGDFAEMVRMEWTEKIEMSDKRKEKSDTKEEKKKIIVAKPTLKSRISKLVSSNKGKK